MAQKRRILLDFVQQSSKPFKIKFIGKLQGSNGQTFPQTLYQYQIQTDGTVDDTRLRYIELDAPDYGYRFYEMELPRDFFGSNRGTERLKFYLNAGSPIPLADLVEAGRLMSISDPVYQFIEDKFGGFDAATVSADVADIKSKLDFTGDGDKALFDDGEYKIITGGGNLGDFAKADLPTIGVPNGALANVTDGRRGIHRFIAATGVWIPINGVYDLMDFAAVRDAVDSIGSINLNSNIFNSSEAVFSPASVGKMIQLHGGGTGGANLFTTIQEYQTPSKVRLATTAKTAVSNKQFVFGTDNTAAINEWRTAALSSLGGKMFAPEGAYLHTGWNLPGLSIVPYVRMKHASLVGEYQPPTFFGTLAGGAERLTDQGTVFICYSDTKPNFKIESGGAFEGFSLYNVKCQYITFRTHENPKQHGVDAHYCSQVIFRDCVFDTGVMNVLSQEPTNEFSALRMPTKNNGAVSIVENCVFSGFFYGVEVEEHTVMRDCSIASCKVGLYFKAGYHSSLFERLSMMCCQKLMRSDDAHASFKFVQLNIEHKTQKQVDDVMDTTGIDTTWQITTDDLDDPNSTLVGEIEYNAVKGGIDVEQVFNKNGGNKVRVYPIGTVPPGFGLPKAAHGEKGGSQDIPNNEFTPISFDNGDGGEGITKTSATEFTASATDIYDIFASINLAAAPNGIRRLIVTNQNQPLLDDQTLGSSSLPATLKAFGQLQLDAGDVIRLGVIHTAGGSLGLNSGNSRLTAQLIIRRTYSL